MTAGTLAVVSVAACGGDGGTGVKMSQPGIRAAAGAGATDTVLAPLSQALVVEVRGAGGALAKGAVVRFAVAASADSSRQFEAPLYVCPLDFTTCDASGGYGGVVTDTADANGRAQARVRLGTIAGPAHVVVTVPELGMKDSVPFTVQPGAPHGVHFTAGDVSVVVGGKAALKATVVDSYNNPRSGAVTYTLGASPGVATFDAAATAVTGVDIGTTYALAQAGSSHDSVGVRVVPSGRLVVWEPGAGAVRMVNTDGSGLKTLAAPVTSSIGVFPRFSPTGALVAFQSLLASTLNGPPQRVVVVDTSGNTRREIDLPSGLASMSQPRVLADGRVLFVGREATQSSYAPLGPAGVYSVATDGTVTKFAPLANASTIVGAVDISPDGLRVAYVVDLSGLGFPGALDVLDLTNGRLAQIDAYAVSPSWSPTGDRVAFIDESDGTLATVRADGTGRTAFTAAGRVSAGLAWSPDGVYVLGRSGDGLTGLRAVRQRDGASVLLRFPAGGTSSTKTATDYTQPDWR